MAESTGAPDGRPAAQAPSPGARATLAAIGIVAFPLLVSYIWICLEFFDGKLVVPRADVLAHFPAPTAASALIVGGWLLFQALLQLLAPGRRVEGTPLSDGSRLAYKMNGWLCWWLSWVCLAIVVAVGRVPPTILADQFGPLLATANVLAFAIAVFLYRDGRRLLARQGIAAGNPILDFWTGTARNPRIGRFDLKLFFEGRPGLIGWVAIDLSLAAKQHQELGTVTAPMILICLFQFWYVADYFLHEEAILTTWDVRHENFGFLLCWGNLVWVPFTFSIQAFYLVRHSPAWNGLEIAGLSALQVAGFAIFRGANIQKHRFRTQPERPVWGKPPRFLKTARGPLLLMSGWWGLARHANYFGDWLMGLAWCLATGFSSALPYFYVTYLTILLVHRERRDHRRCTEAYGEDWQNYCRNVPWRIVPGLY